MTTYPNDLWLSNSPAPTSESHFKLSEFANEDGLAMLYPDVLTAAELLRADLAIIARAPVAIRITDSIRSRSDNYRLARKLGWIDQGGAVSPDSRHLTEYGGIAIDFVAYLTKTGEPIPQSIVGPIASRHFDYVKADYPDGHTHADQRLRGRAAARLYP